MNPYLRAALAEQQAKRKTEISEAKASENKAAKSAATSSSTADKEK